MSEETELVLNQNLMVSEERRRRRRFSLGKKARIFLLTVLLLAVFLGVFGVLPAVQLFASVKEVYQEALKVKVAYQNQDLEAMEQNLETTQEKFLTSRRQYQRLRWSRYLPFLGRYWDDGNHLFEAGKTGLEAATILIKAIEPYADIIGFKGGEGFAAKTAEERVIFVLQTLEKITPQMEAIGAKLNLVRDEVLAIDSRRYPKSFRGKAVREKITEFQEVINNSAEAVASIKPAMSLLPQLLGEPDEKTYLLLFQNDAELRPTGGFLTAYAILKVHHGKITPVLSQDIYALDASFGKRLPAPEPIKKYLPLVYYWHLRDMNLSPDFKVAMDTFSEHYPGPGFDGIIALDTTLPVELLKILGPIGVADWGNFSAEEDPRCQCPQVIYELERLITKPVGTIRKARKAVLGPLMHSILLNVMGSPRRMWPEFFNVAMTAIKEKHLLLYFKDEEAQKAAGAFNAAGRIQDYEADYLHINDCNFAAAKSNMFIKVNVDQEIEVSGDGTATKTLTINYKNPEPPSDCNLEKGELCLNGPYRNWFRVYVPQGSELIEGSGSEVEMTTYEELGKTVFEGFFGDKHPLRPLGSAKVILKYKLPFKIRDEYRLLIQKQPGTYGYQYGLEIDGQREEFELLTDKEFRLQR